MSQDKRTRHLSTEVQDALAAGEVGSISSSHSLHEKFQVFCCGRVSTSSKIAMRSSNFEEKGRGEKTSNFTLDLRSVEVLQT